MNHIFKRMQELERFIEPLIAKSDAWVLDCPATQPVDNQENVVSQSLKCLARIKLNRYVVITTVYVYEHRSPC